MIKAITFDFWSTLYQSKTADYTKRLLTLKNFVEQRGGATLDLEQFKAAVRVARNTWRRTWMEEYRTIDAGEWLGVMLNEIGVSLAPADLLEIQSRLENSVLSDLPTLVPEGKAVLADLSEHHKLALISDTGITPGRVLRQILKNDDIGDYFTQLTFSDEVGRSKPHPEAFLTTLKALAVEPQEAVHVGDLLRSDIAGAQSVGMRAVLYIGVTQDEWIAASDASATSVVPDAVIKSHTELAPLLRQWNGTGAASTLYALRFT
jgi:putative hydrolase of the HAD superfamily